MMSIKSNRGFTLIELVIVIVILGILAASAAPKFINLKGDAVIANINALEGNLKSANMLVYAKSIIQNETVGVGEIDQNGIKIATSYGSIVANSNNILNTIDGSFTVMSNAADDFSTDWGIYQIPNSGVSIYPKGYNVSDNCSLYYIEADANFPVTYTQTISGC